MIKKVRDKDYFDRLNKLNLWTLEGNEIERI